MSYKIFYKLGLGARCSYNTERAAMSPRGKKQKWYMATCSMEHYMSMSPIHPSIEYFIGQREESDSEDPYEHFHFAICFKQQKRIVTIKKLFPTWNFKPITDIDGAITYVTKLENRVPDSLVEGGTKPFIRSSKRDWDKIKDSAKKGDFDSIDAQIFVTHYNSLKRIRADYCTPPERININVFIYWGISRSGKSFRAKKEAEEMGSYYCKIPSTKWWCGYQGQPCVILNEFTGKISIEHLLLWLDWTPCVVETKGGSTPLFATSFWITSNKPPHQWWPECHPAQWDAFLQRVTNSIEFTERYVPGGAV